MIRSVFMRFPGGLAKTVTFSYDDGCQEDERLVGIFDKYGMKATFNHNSDELRPFNFTKEEVKSLFLDKGHEIAVHGELHRANGITRPIDGIRDVLNCRLILEEKCDRIIRGMAYPDSGITKLHNTDSYETIKRYLTDLGIMYARTLGGDNDSFMLPTDFHAWMPTAHHDNPNIMEWIDAFLALDPRENTYHSRRYSRLFYIWGHSYEFGRKDNWEHIERICERLGGKDDTWYATNIEISEYVEAYKRLVYSADGRKVYNPTVRTVWIDADGRVLEIAPDTTVTIE